MHGIGVMKYAAGDVSKSIGVWKEGKKCGLFEDVPRHPVSKQVHYDNDEVKTDLNENDTKDFPPNKRLCVSPKELHESKMKEFSGNGKIKYHNGNVYEGEYKNSEPHGAGKMTYSDGRVQQGIWNEGKIEYEGELNDNGRPHGRGKKIYSDGNIYEGEWTDGVKNGKGTYKWFNGDSYVGEWKEDKIHGEGIKKRPGGSVFYDGEWKDNKRNGKGVYKRRDGSVVYEGEWNDGKYQGNGTYYFENGDVYTGDFRADEIHGKGVMKYANKEIYDGEWKKHRKDGRGTMKFHNGDMYTGEFSNDKMHGKGVFEYADGDILKSIGEWREGKKCGLFEDIVRVIVHKQVYYENDEVKSDPKVKREALYDEDTDTEDYPPSKRLCVSPP